MTKHLGAAIALMEHEKKPYSVVQIGAYIGATHNDPLYYIFRFGKVKHGKLHAVEPIARYCEELRNNYEGENVSCHQVAIGTESGTLGMLCVDPAAVWRHKKPEWLEQISSLKTDRLTELWDRCETTSESNNELKDFCQRHATIEVVKVLTLKDFMESVRLTAIDLLVIDAEGSEEDILKQVDFPVRFLQYEHALLADDSYREFLRGNAWITVQEGPDTFAWKDDDVAFTRILEELA